MAIYLELSRGELRAAQGRLDALPVVDPRSADAAHLRAWIRGEVAKALGDHRTALDAFAAQDALEAWMGGSGAAATERAESLQRIGRHDEALAVLRQATEGSTAPCDAAWNNLAWGLLLARESGHAVPSPSVALDRAEAESSACDGPVGPELAVHVAQNRALAHLQEGDLEAAAAALPSTPLTDEQQAWQAVLAARIAAGRGDASAALTAWDKVIERSTGRLDLVWRARDGRAAALAHLGDVDGAVTAYAASAALLRSQAVLVPVHGGRDAFLSQRQAAVAAHVGLLLDRGDAAAALHEVRRHRGQYLGTLHQVARLAALDPAGASLWAELVEAGPAADRLDAAAVGFTPAPAELRAAAPGELLLTWMPMGEGWVGFAQDASGTQSALLGPLPADPEGLAAGLFAPFADAIRRAERVTFLPVPELHADVHLLPFDGAPLLAGRPVRTGLDLSAEVRPEPASPESVLLVYNPDDTLVGALREGRAVQAALPGAVALTWPDATRAAVLSALPRADLLHYAGHAVSGSESFGGALRVADGELSGAHVFGRSAPRVAVLSACDTGRGTETAVSSLGLAQSFLAAGTELVIATDRPLDDRLGAAFAEALYRHLPAAGWSEAYRRSVLELAPVHPDAGALRLYVP